MNGKLECINTTTSLNNNVIEVSKNEPDHVSHVNDNCIEINIVSDVNVHDQNEELDQNDQSVSCNKNNSIAIVNISDLNKKDGWNLHYKTKQEEIYYYYENGVRIKKMERQSDGKWKESDLMNPNVYEIGDDFERKCRYGYYLKYENGILKEENKYFRDSQIGVHKEFEDNIMKEYNLKGELIYLGSYTMDSDQRYTVRNGHGSEYHKGKVVYEGLWINDNGFNKEYCFNSKDDMPVGKLVVSEVATGLLISFLCYILALLTKSNDFMILYILGMFILCKAFVNQFQGICSCIIGTLLQLPYFIIAIQLEFYFPSSNHYVLSKHPVAIFVYVIVAILIVYSIISTFFIISIKQDNPGDNMFLILYKDKGWICILIDLLIGYLPVFHSYYLLSDYECIDNQFDLRWCGIFMVFNSIMYFLLSYLQTYHNNIFKIGCYFGIFWGVFAFSYSVVFYFLCKNYYLVYNRVFYYYVGIHMFYHGLYSLPISLFSLLLYCVRKEDEEI